MHAAELVAVLEVRLDPVDVALEQAVAERVGRPGADDAEADLLVGHPRDTLDRLELAEVGLVGRRLVSGVVVSAVVGSVSGVVVSSVVASVGRRRRSAVVSPLRGLGDRAGRVVVVGVAARGEHQAGDGHRRRPGIALSCDGGWN